MRAHLLTFVVVIGLLGSSLAPLPRPRHAMADDLCPTTIRFGEPIACAITATAEIDTFTFPGEPGDKILVRATRTSDTLSPRIRIREPSGDEICSAVAPGMTAEISACSLPRSGTYLLSVESLLEGQFGSYRLYVQRLNNPGNTQPIAFGQTITASINTTAELDIYTFPGAAGNKILVRATRTSDTLSPRIRIRDPSGDEICSAVALGMTAEISACSLPSPGVYSLSVEALLEGQTGGYRLYLQCLNAGCGSSSSPGPGPTPSPSSTLSPSPSPSPSSTLAPTPGPSSTLSPSPSPTVAPAPTVVYTHQLFLPFVVSMRE